MKNNVFKGSLFVALGASSYGMLSTFVKLAYQEGFSTGEVTLSQFSLGFVGLFILNLFGKRQSVANAKPTGYKGIFKLMAAGTSMGLTSICYYMAVRYIPVSVAIVLLMQTVWMGVILEMVLHKKAPGSRKILSVIIILAGTVLATDMLKQAADISWIGIGWGLLAAVSYTAAMYTSNNIELHLPPIKRSMFMILGGLIIIACVFHSAIALDFSYKIIPRWGLILSLFGTILPPLLFTRGMPLTGIGLGAIIAAVEIPVSVLMAHLLLKEAVSFNQWAGIVLILFAVVLMNLEKKETNTLKELV